MNGGWQTMTPSPEARIAALEAELASARAELQEFTSTVAHDLRAPLRHITSYVQLVQEDAGPLLDAEVQGFLATITDSARHMGVLLDALTTLSRLGSVAVVLAPVSLPDLVREVCDTVAHDQPQRVLDWQVAADLPVLQTDANLLRQALLHVVGNAVKFTALQPVARIEISTLPGADGRHLTLQVRDNGAGYNPVMQSKLFRVFGRLHSATQFDGIGMGLVLTRKLLQRLGGSVDSEGAVNGGCCVRLHLPLT